MTDQHGDNSGWDKSRWGGEGRDKAGWDKSVWAEASREDAERASEDQASAGRDSVGSDSASRDSTGRDSAGRTVTPRDNAQRGGGSRGGGGNRQSGQSRPATRSRQAAPGSDMLTDFQRWLLRSGAKSMRRELNDQVRRTFGGGRRDTGDVWDTATTEIPPEVGESPECQWCPICRAARAMRDSGPSVGDHLWTAGDMVASAVKDALTVVDSALSKTAGGSQQAAPRDDWAEGSEGWAAARDSWAAEHGGLVSRPGTGTPDDDGEADNQTEGPDEPDNRR
jgi:hypothetical protein